MNAAGHPIVAALPQAPLVRFADRTMSAGEFVARARALAARLPRATYVLNLCEDRYEFLLAFAAALLAGQTSLLPPSRADGVLRRLLDRYAPSYALAGTGCDFTAPSVVRMDALRCADLAAMPVVADVPRIPPARLACIAFTSGSTGEPAPSPKTWGALFETGAETAARFGFAGDGGETVIATVPPQHMFGLETSILLPLAGRAVMHAGRPLLAADVDRAIGATAGRRWLMTTPVSLRAFVAEPGFRPALEGIISATMPLERALACAVEHDWNVPLHEIYGCTEGGSIATRRLTVDAAWRPLGDITIAIAGETAQVTGGHLRHLEGPVPLSDVITVESPRRFILHGRAANLVKVGGKRTTLEALDHALLAIPGVVDGMFHVPDGAARPTAFVVAPGLSARAILDALRDRIDPVFLPRPLRLVPRLPRNDLGKVPRAALATLGRSGAQ